MTRELSPDEQEALGMHRKIVERLSAEIEADTESLKTKRKQLKFYEKHIRGLTGEKPQRRKGAQESGI